jgi:hypothetical protein
MDHQGMKYNNGKQQIIQKGFKSGREGFSGILGPNANMNNVISNETANTLTKTYAQNDNIAQYGEKYKELTQKTEEYVKNSNVNETIEKNYNVFVNRSMGPAEIKETNQKGCVTRDSISNLTLAAGFAEAYPNNFPNYAEANTACKIWAADSAQSVYAVTRDANFKYQCYTGQELAPKITTMMKPAILYTVLEGDTTAVQGGLFYNGQIGVWGGGGGSSAGGGGAADPQWNINNMLKPSLLKKYNSTDYSSGPKGVEQIVRDNWWGTPGAGGWGGNYFPNDKQAWWISNEDYNYMGTMGYFYYIYTSPTARNIGIYTVVDDSSVLKVNGQTLSGQGGNFGANLKEGKNVIEYKLVNTGGPGAFVFYAYEVGNNNNVFFRSGDAGWGYTMNPVPDFNLITNVVIDQVNPNGIKTVNPVPAGYDKCDSVLGGGIQKSSIAATYGRNCSNTTNPPLGVRYLRVTPNNNGDYIQIAQIVVNAFVNGAITNVAPRGTCTAANAWGGWDLATKNAAIKSPMTGGWIYHSARGGDSWWQLDLGQDYPVTEIIYYNRIDCCQDRANGMKIQLRANDGTAYQPITLTGALKQSFNISTKGLTAKPRTNAIKTMLNQKCLDQSNGRKDWALQAQVWDCGETNPNQDYTYNSDKTISAPGSNLCVDVYGGQSGNGTSVIQWQCHRGPNQKWNYGVDKTLRPQHAPNKCLDVYGWNQANGAKLVIWDCHGGANQQWDIKS